MLYKFIWISRLLRYNEQIMKYLAKSDLYIFNRKNYQLVVR